ncbi:unnamed protein product, partial [Rotaria sp. Silwood1]
MKAIGLVLDLQANKMWLRTQPNLKYDISSDLINAGRIDVPLLSTQLRTVPPYHIAFIQVKTPSSLSSDTWQASISGIHRHVIAANSLVRIENQCCFIQVANCSSKPQVIYPGQHLAIADLYDGDNNEITHAQPILSLTTTRTSSTFNFNENNSSHLISCFTELQELPKQGDQKKELFSTCDHQTKHVSQVHDKSNLKYFNYHFLELDSHNTPNFMILPLHYNLSSNTSLNENFNTSTTNSFDFLTNLNLSDTDLTIHQIEQLKSLLVKYYKCFEDTLGRTSLVQHHIDTG